MNVKKWLAIYICIVMGLTVSLMISVVVIDPYLHFHGPLSGLEYPFNDPRYVNDGIIRHFDYEAMITGTSMSDNFSTSRLEKEWNCEAIKVTFSGATYHEISENIARAIDRQPKLKRVICSIDPNNIGTEEDTYTYEGCPVYLYDDIWWNDVKYVFNKDVIVQALAVINYTRAGKTTPTFDEYARYDLYRPFGREAVLASYNRMEKQDLGRDFSEEDRIAIYNNITNNYVKLARDNPQVEFYFFIPPYSMCYWDGLVRTNQLDYAVAAMKYGIGLLVAEKNIHVYGFDNKYEITTNLDRYMDTIHYDAKVNDLILESILKGENELSIEDVSSYYDEIVEFYQHFEFPFGEDSAEQQETFRGGLCFRVDEDIQVTDMELFAE